MRGAIGRTEGARRVRARVARRVLLFVTLLAAGPASTVPHQPIDAAATLNAPLPGPDLHREQYAMSRLPSDCLDPRRSGYADIRRNLAAILSARLCYRRETLSEGGFRWVFHLLHHPHEPDGPFWVLPHDNEDTAFDAAVYAVVTYGGGFLSVDSGHQRHLLGQDPNRNFSRGWTESMLCREQARPAPDYTAAVISHFKKRGPLPFLSLHNNRDGWRDGGGRGTVSVHRRDPYLLGFPSAHARGQHRDQDNLVFLAGLEPYPLNRRAQRRVAALNRLGLDVVYKRVTDDSFNCSLGDYVVRNRLGDYYNLEAQHGHLSAQKGMIDRLMKHLGRRPAGGSPHDGGPFLGGSFRHPAAEP
jgi:hypothetical protein